MSHKIVLGSEIAIKSSFNKIRRQRATLTGAASQGRNIRLTTDNGDNINVIVVHWNQFVLFAQVCLDKKLFIIDFHCKIWPFRKVYHKGLSFRGLKVDNMTKIDH